MKLFLLLRRPSTNRVQKKIFVIPLLCRLGAQVCKYFISQVDNLIAKELHFILNNNRSNPDHVNLKLYKLLLEEDLIKLMYKGLKSILEQSAPLTNTRRHQKDMNIGNQNFTQNSSNFNQVQGASYLRSRQAKVQCTGPQLVIHCLEHLTCKL